MPIIEIKDSVTDLSTYNYCSDHKFQVLDYLDINYSEFFENYMIKNIPCVIKNVTKTWDCTNKWIRNETVHLEYFISNFGELDAPVADCNIINFNTHCKSIMKVKDYMRYLQNSNREKLLYLKDWHLQKDRPNDKFYKVPHVFASDWLNEFATDNKEDDFMFVYIGPQNSWTPLHVDVYCSYSWSVNVVGRKKWLFFPPGEEEKLKDPLGNLPVLFSSDKFPNVKYYEIIQEKGDALFVPSGWHHEVVNLLDTISINHNWVNGCNIETVWLSLQQCLLSVEKEIIDLKDTPEYASHCQIMLKSLFGMNYADFIKFLCYIGKKRLGKLEGENRTGFYDFELGQNHILFDLKAVYKIMNLIQNHPLYSINITLCEQHKLDFINTKNAIFQLLHL